MMLADFPKKGEFSPTVTRFYYGFDISTYPGDSQMSTWWTSSPFYWVGFYLAPAPHHSNTSWMSKRSTLKNQGWGLAPIYVGRQAGDGSKLTTAQGITDAQNASSLASQAGFPSNAFVFLDIEQGGTLSTAFMNYIKGWINELFNNTPFNVGVYCNAYQTAAQIRAAVPTIGVQFWCVNVNCPPSQGCVGVGTPPDPHGCGVTYSGDWQFAQSPKPGGINCPGYTGGNCSQTFGGVTLLVDLDTSYFANPSFG
jgi:hypothetical protein